MKKTLLTIMITALFSGMIYGAQARVERSAADANAMTAKELDVPVPGQQRLYEMADRLSLEAKNAYWLGNYQVAVELYHLLLRSGRNDCHDIYNLACCYSKLGNERQAAKYLCLSVEAGFEDIDHIMNDPDFQKIRETSCFKKAIEKMGRMISKRNEQEKTRGSDTKMAAEPSGNDNAPLAGAGIAPAVVGNKPME